MGLLGSCMAEEWKQLLVGRCNADGDSHQVERAFPGFPRTDCRHNESCGVVACF